MPAATRWAHGPSWPPAMQRAGASSRQALVPLLAESLARLEPEVSAVQNELVVGSAETTAEVLPQAAQ